MIRKFKDYVVNEENKEDLRKLITNNPTRKKMIAICSKYGYNLETAVIHKISETGSLYIISIAEPHRSYYPRIYFNDDYYINQKIYFSIQTTSYGALKTDEYEKFIKCCNDAYNLVKELNKLDLSTLPVIKKY